MFNNDYDDMVKQVKAGREIEVAIWDNDYNEKLIHLVCPNEEGGHLWQPQYYNKF